MIIHFHLITKRDGKTTKFYAISPQFQSKSKKIKRQFCYGRGWTTSPGATPMVHKPRPLGPLQWSTNPVPLVHSLNEVCPLVLFRFGKAKLLFSKGDALHEKRHIPGQDSHGLETFKVLNRLPCTPSVNAVPVLA